jgi:hypothetical protein
VLGFVAAGVVAPGTVALGVDVELELLPQPAANAPPASATMSHVDRFRMILSVET